LTSKSSNGRARSFSGSSSPPPKGGPLALDVDELRFGDELEAFRVERGLSWSDLAAASNVSATYLRDLRNGRRGQRWPSPAVVEAVARALDAFLLTRARLVLAHPAAVDLAYNAVLAGTVA
jgi:ribosome-binding protein aMBF1 (putative translation factor)